MNDKYLKVLLSFPLLFFPKTQIGKVGKAIVLLAIGCSSLISPIAEAHADREDSVFRGQNANAGEMPQLDLTQSLLSGESSPVREITGGVQAAEELPELDMTQDLLLSER